MHLSWTGEPLSQRTLAPYVEAISGKTPSGSWIERHLQDNPHLWFRRPTGLDPKQARAFNEKTVKRHFHLFQLTIAMHNILPKSVYNMDEKGGKVGGGGGNKCKTFICGSRQCVSIKLQASNLELVTVVECVSANGVALKPSFILSGAPGNIQEQWFDEEGVGFIAVSKNGWTNDELTYLWFVKVFVPQAKAQNTTNQPILLILDGHGSHTTNKMQDYGYSRQPCVHIYLLPPHTTHCLQPLDVGVFGVAQCQWQHLCNTRVKERNPVTWDLFVPEWMALQHLFMQQDIILLLWSKTGLYLFNPKIFTDEDFAPSCVTSTCANKPANYPGYEYKCSTDEDGLDSEAQENNIPADTQSLGSQHPPLPPHNQAMVAGQANLPNEEIDSPASPCPINFSNIDLAPLERLLTLTLDKPGNLQQQGLAEMQNTGKDLIKYAKQASKRIKVAKEKLARAETRAEQAEAHAQIMAHWNAKQQRNINAKKTAMAIRQQEREEEQQQAEEIAAWNKQLERKKDQRQAEQEANAPSIIWTAAWRQKPKPTLQDLAYVLRLLLEGKNQELVERINAHLVLNPALAQDQRFASLYTGAKRAEIPERDSETGRRGLLPQPAGGTKGSSENTENTRFEGPGPLNLNSKAYGAQ
ncbi:DDE superfamily endonuclease [Rhizoctonia solani]|uniref:DDE superfamily endonuclease n=1 Tax=Rhizoctonia solani TaxID=456999 RepID=A0A8H7HE51_9AGAM|nr:DDE superfamily endonuclease [Rhizoctonia solani]